MHWEWCIRAAILNQTTWKRWIAQETATTVPPPWVRSGDSESSKA